MSEKINDQSLAAVARKIGGRSVTGGSILMHPFEKSDHWTFGSEGSIYRIAFSSWEPHKHLEQREMLFNWPRDSGLLFTLESFGDASSPRYEFDIYRSFNPAKEGERVTFQSIGHGDHRDRSLAVLLAFIDMIEREGG